MPVQSNGFTRIYGCGEEAVGASAYRHDDGRIAVIPMCELHINEDNFNLLKNKSVDKR